MSESNDNNSNPTTPQSPGARRTSFTTQALADMFGANRNRASAGNTNDPNSVVAAAASAQRRRMSLNGIGFATANGANSLGGFKRTGSISSHNSNVIDENAVEDGEPLSAQETPSTPFGRRMSFGARALRDVRTGYSPGSMGTNGRSPNANAADDGGKKTTPPGIMGRDTGYNWADSFRNRAERSASIASQQAGSPPNPTHHRSQTVATMQAPPVQQPQAQPQPQPQQPRGLDHMQERILKGDFYMD